MNEPFGMRRVIARIDEIQRRFTPATGEGSLDEVRPRSFEAELRALQEKAPKPRVEERRRGESLEDVVEISSRRGQDVVSVQAVDDFGQEWESVIPEVARRHDVPVALVRAVIRAESSGNVRAVSPKGAQGLMQLMPGTAALMGVDDPFDPVQNIEGGTAYLSSMLKRYGGDMELALAAYNAGPGRVDAYGGIPPIPETQNYVKNVLALYRLHREEE